MVLARVDNRLVHGQVLEAWVPRLGAQAVVVVDREKARDPLHRMILEGLGRPGLEVRLEDPAGAARWLAREGRERRVLVLFEGLAQALEALEAGVEFAVLNLGNLHPRPGSRPVTPTVYLTEEDWRGLERLRAAGVEVEARAVPADRSPAVLAAANPEA